ncbi:hypothetical protein FXB41_39655 [Bradyrhizobium canariense]|nr:hypothetical protein [Bradyrhizobium canariense]
MFRCARNDGDCGDTSRNPSNSPAAAEAPVEALPSRHRHCEEPLRRSNPDCSRGNTLDCFAALAMTECVARPSRPSRCATPPAPSSPCRDPICLRSRCPGDRAW